MSIRDLLKDPAVISGKFKGDERNFAGDFVQRRVRLFIEANPSFQHPTKPGDLTDIATKGVSVTLSGELPLVQKAHADILVRVMADVGKGLHVDITKGSLRKRVFDRPPAGDADTMRKQLVLSIVYQATALDIRLADAANREQLHRLCDRRLRLVERMLYDVGRSAARTWSEKQVRSKPTGPWIDGLERMFDTPGCRVRPSRPLATLTRKSAASRQWPNGAWATIETW